MTYILSTKRRLFSRLPAAITSRSLQPRRWGDDPNIKHLCRRRPETVLLKYACPTSFQNRAMTTSSLSSGSLSSSDSYETIRSQVHQLSSETEDICTRSGSVNVSEVLSVIEKWHRLSTSIQIPAPLKRNRFATSSSQEAPSFHITNNKELRNLKDTKSLCAEEMDRLLEVHLKIIRNDPLSKVDTRPFSLVMEGWRDSGSPLAGNKTANSLAAWGDLYGGDLDHAPTIEQFNCVLDAHAMSSLGDYSFFQNAAAAAAAADNTVSDTERFFPAEQSWDLFSFLSSLNDVTLLPNAVSCSHLIHALSNHAFVMRYAKKEFRSEMNDEIAGIRAYSGWKKMMEHIDKKNPLDEETSALVWRAHADMLTLSSHGMLRRGQHDESDAVIDTIGTDTEDLLKKVIPTMKNNDLEDEKIVACLHQCYSAAMVAWGRQIEKRQSSYGNDMLQTATPVEALIALMEQQKLTVMPDHYHAIIQIYANFMKADLSRVDEKVQRKIMHQMLYYLDELESNHLADHHGKNLNELAMKSTNPRSQVAAVIFYTVINSFYLSSIQNGTRAAYLQKVENVFERMLDFYENDLLWIERGAKPIVAAFNRILMMQTRLPSKHIEPKVLRLFDLLRSHGSKFSNDKLKHNALKLDSGCYLAYLKLLCKCNFAGVDDRVFDAFKDMKENEIKPITLVHYTTGVKALGPIDSGKKAKQLLLEAIREYNCLSPRERVQSEFKAAALYNSFISSARPNSSHAVAMLNTLESRYQETEDPNLKPSIELYAAVLNQISHARDNVFPRAMDIFQRIESLYEKGDESFKPNKFCFNPLIVAIAKSNHPDRVNLVESFLLRMKELLDQTGDDDIKPDHITYSSVLLAISRGEKPINIARADELLDMVEEKARKNEMPWPGPPAYSSYLKALTRSDSKDIGDKAESILRRMDKAYASGGYAAKADHGIFALVIQAWALSNKPDKASKAWALFEEMRSRCGDGNSAYMKTNIGIIISVLKACARTSGLENRQEAFKIALRIQLILSENKHRRSYKPNSEYFKILMTAFGICAPDDIERERRINSAFEECCREGLVDKSILDDMRKYAPKLYRKLKASTTKTQKSAGAISVNDLPPACSRNVSAQRYGKRTRNPRSRVSNRS